MNGHFASVQMGFVEASVHLGERFILCDGETFWELDESNNLVATSKQKYGRDIYKNIEMWLAESNYPDEVTLMVFEGALSTVIDIAEFARAYPKIRIYVNLFYPEPGLSIPGTYDHFVGQITDYQSTHRVKEVVNLLNEIPNIRIACDSDARSLLARSMGIRVDDTWLGRSPLGFLSRQLTGSTYEERNPENNLKVFITVDIQRFTASQLWWCVNVIRFVNSISERQRRSIEWTFNFTPEEVSKKLRAITHFLPRENTFFVKSKVSLDRYARRIHEADVIWLPLSSYYASSSSGRVADAITLLKPILVPSGTYGDFEFSKWIPNWPTYRNQLECAQILLNFQTLLPLGNELLWGQKNAIRDYYSNVKQLKKVIGIKVEERSINFSQHEIKDKLRVFENRLSILYFAKSLLYSLSPSLNVKLVKLITEGARRKLSKKFQ